MTEVSGYIAMMLFLAVLSASLMIGIVVYVATSNWSMACLAYAFLPLLSLSLWVGQVLLGSGPGPFVPNWVAGGMTLLPFVWSVYVRIDEEVDNG